MHQPQPCRALRQPELRSGLQALTRGWHPRHPGSWEWPCWLTINANMEASLVNCVGMLPVSLLSFSSRTSSRVRVDSSLPVGMVPEMAL
jgi:hypothetical protein